MEGSFDLDAEFCASALRSSLSVRDKVDVKSAADFSLAWPMEEILHRHFQVMSLISSVESMAYWDHKGLENEVVYRDGRWKGSRQRLGGEGEDGRLLGFMMKDEGDEAPLICISSDARLEVCCGSLAPKDSTDLGVGLNVDGLSGYEQHRPGSRRSTCGGCSSR